MRKGLEKLLIISIGFPPNRIVPLIAVLAALTIPHGQVATARNFALQFDGVNDLCEIVPHPSLNITSAITIETWLKWRGLLGVASFQIILNRDIVAYEISIGDNVGSGKFLWAFGNVSTSAPDVGGGWSDGGGPIQQDVWTHVALTYDGAQAITYINGQEATNFSTSGSIRSQPSNTVRIGMRDLMASPSFFHGEIDEMRLWNVARTQQEVQDFMNAPVSVDSPGLVAYWNFDVGEGQLAPDLSPNGNNARLGTTDGIDSNDPAWILSDVPFTFSSDVGHWELYE